MKYLMISLVGVCLLLCSVPAMADQAEDEAAIREATKQFNAALNKNDTKTIAALLDENLETWEGSVKGRAAFIKRFEEYPDMSVKFLDEIGIVFLTPDVAVHKFTEENSGWTDDDGNALPPQKGRRAYVYIRKNGKWLRGAMFWRPTEE